MEDSDTAETLTAVTLHSIRTEFDELVSGKDIDKESALTIVRLQHAMETLYTKTIYDKETEIKRLTFELSSLTMKQENQELKHKHAQCREEHENLLEKHQQDTKEFTLQLDEHVNTINRLQQQMSLKKKR